MSKKLIVGLVLLGLIALIAVVNHAGDNLNLVAVTVYQPIGLLVVGALGVIAGMLMR